MSAPAAPAPESNATRQQSLRTPDEIKRHQDLFDDHKKQVWSDMQAGSDEFDRALLTMSSGTLALSLAFIKDVVPLAEATHLPLLFASWVSFALCIVVTLVSFRFSIIAQENHLEFARRYHIDGDLSASNERHWSKKALGWCAYVGGVLLLIGFALTISFAIINVEAIKMKDSEKKAESKGVMVQDGRFPVNVVASPGQEERGRQAIPVVQAEPLEKGRQPVPIVTVPAKTGTQTGGAGSGTSGQQGSGEKK